MKNIKTTSASHNCFPTKIVCPLFGLILLFLVSNISGQTIIFGQISCTGKGNVGGISVLAIATDTSQGILNYSISDNSGQYKLSYTSSSDSVFIAFKSLNFKDTIVGLLNQSQKFDIKLLPDVFEIKEVSVRGNPISVRGDTINYVVNAFAKAGDRSVGDVISRMPGFEVTELGQIYYQGKPIQKYYIEGMDLLEKRYALANKNLPHKSVSSVEVLQNHQPFKMLEDKMASDETSINIKLKNDVAVTGTMYAGAGFSPMLHDINLTPMLFNKKQQIIATWQSNNIGEDLNTQHQPLVFSNGELQGYKNRKPELLGILQLSKPQIDKERYLDNDANLVSYNHLLKIKNGTELKINSSFYHDKTNEEGKVETSYFLDSDTVTFSEITQNKHFNKSLSTDLKITQNEKKRYLTNKFSINKFWDSEEGLIRNQGELVQKAETPHFSLANDFDILLPVKQNFVRFYSFVDYNNSPQHLSFSPGVFEDVLNNGQPYGQTMQNFIERNLVTHNFIQFTLSRKPWIFETEPGIRFEHQELETSIERDQNLLLADSLGNNLNWNYTELYLSENIRFEKSKLKLSLKLPFNFQNYNIRDKIHTSSGELQKLLFTPSVNLKYDLNGFWILRAGAKYNQQMGEVSLLTQGYVFSSYRQLKRGIDQLAVKNGMRYNLKVEFKNPISGFFSTLGWSVSYTTNNLLLKQQVNERGLLFYDVVEKDNRSNLQNLSFAINQYLSNWQATVDFKANYSRNKKEYLLNNQLGWLRNKVYAFHPGISVNRWKKVDLEYSYALQIIDQTSQQADISVVDQKHSGSIFYTPEKRHLFGLSGEYYSTKQSGQHNSNVLFANFSYHLKPSKGKLKYKLEIRNIFNHSEMVRYYNSDISLVRSNYSIRPRQFLVTVSLGL